MGCWGNHSVKILRIICTLYYLKPIQIWGRVWFEIKKRILKPWIVNIVKQRTYSNEPQKLFLTPRCYAPLAMQNLSEKQFVFLNVSADHEKEIQWNDPSKSKLWLYNLHYFEYLLPLTHQVNQKNFNAAKVILEDWMQKNTIGSGNGWEPYPISLRSVHWIYFYHAYYDFFQNDPTFRQQFLNSLFRQIAYLRFFIEKHLQANHLWADVKALLFAGLFFNEKAWIRQGLKLVRRELEEQILADGGHYERSPMYHALILTDVLDLIQLIAAGEKVRNSSEAGVLRLKPFLLEKAHAMERWLEGMTQPDGQLPLLGDTAFGIAAEPEAIKRYFKAVAGQVNEPLPTLKSLAFKNSGYFIFRDAQRYLVIDGGELGVSYQPGHAHCDLLSYEFSVKGQRLIVDSGVGEYLPTELRQKARSIYSHNTLVVNGLEQAELWSAFRMGRRVRPQQVSVKTEPVFEFTGAYRNAMDKKLGYWHQRKIKAAQSIEIEDQWKAQTVLSVENLIHLHPECEIEMDAGKITIKRKDAAVLLTFDAQKIKTELRDWFYVPEFGKILPSKVLVLMPDVNLEKMAYSIQMY